MDKSEETRCQVTLFLFALPSLVSYRTGICCCVFYVHGKAPVTPSRVFTALVRSCLILRSAVRSQENPDIFREKRPVTASWQRPMRCYGAGMTFYRVLTEFLLAIICALTTLSRRSKCMHCTFTAFALR